MRHASASSSTRAVFLAMKFTKSERTHNVKLAEESAWFIVNKSPDIYRSSRNQTKTFMYSVRTNRCIAVCLIHVVQNYHSHRHADRLRQDWHWSPHDTDSIFCIEWTLTALYDFVVAGIERRGKKGRKQKKKTIKNTDNFLGDITHAILDVDSAV